MAMRPQQLSYEIQNFNNEKSNADDFKLFNVGET